MSPVTLPLPHLRRLALGAQGLLQRQPFARGKKGVLGAIEHLNYVQIDTISVIERAHNHVLWTRVPGYRREALDQLGRDHLIFDYWHHAAAWLPMSAYPLYIPTMQARRKRYAGQHRRLRAFVHDRIRAEGPLRARDFEDTAARGAWWDWKPAKRALDILYHTGDLICTYRDGFQKVYDLTERVLPTGTPTTAPPLRERAARTVNDVLRAHGFANANQITYGRRDPALKAAVVDYLRQAERRGELQLLDTPAGRAHARPEALQQIPRNYARVRLLSPFDNAVIQRRRLESLFGLDYQIECYVPAEERRFGYFCLPLQWGAAVVGRVDAKADRATGVLLVHAIHIEQPPADEEPFCAALATALHEFAEFNGCGEFTIARILPARFAAPVRAACANA